MNTKKTVFSRIAKGMPKKKIELSLVDDAKDLITSYADVEENIAFSLSVQSELEYKIVLSEYEALLSQINNVKPDLENAINELGINRDNFQVLDDLDELEDKINERINIVKENIELLLKIN
jgi:hypothetical protein